jgi:diguanylate cyclase (GGDEF)-like protein/PAS domain S-box-containing protein
MVAGFATVHDVGWGVMVPQPLYELERSAEALRAITLSVVLLGMLASALLSWYLAGRLTRPVLAVTQAAARMARGRAASRLELRSWLPSELGSLMHSFNAMVEKISGTERELRASNARMADFANTAADWFWEMNEKLEFTYLSERFQEVCGVPPSVLVGRTPRQIVDELASNPASWESELQNFESHQSFRDVQFPWRRPDGEVRALASSGRPRFDDDGKFIGYRGAARDVTHAHKLAKELRYQAHHDALTGLVNRREFESRLHKAWMSARERGVESALCYMDLDQFKVVNDTVGHVAGDAMLAQIADLLRSRVRARDTLARLGGDEFSLLLDNCALEKAEEIAHGVCRSLQEYRFVWEEQVFTVGISIGLVAVGAASESAVQVLSQADLACYTAKDLGRNRIHVFRPEDREVARRQREILHASALSRALEDGRFSLMVQRIQPLNDDFVPGSVYEVLVRMEGAEGREIAPSVIIPAAERFGLMGHVDGWVIRNALRKYRELAGEIDELHLSINLSASSLGDAAVLALIRECLDEYGVPGARVCFEITETSAIGSVVEARRFMLELKQLGCRFALDDFGSGLSSFSYLRQLPVDYLKIDGSFVSDMLESPVDRAMVESIHRIAKTLGILTIAECVDSVELLHALREVGIDAAQGFAVHRPEPIDGVMAGERSTVARTG